MAARDDARDVMARSNALVRRSRVLKMGRRGDEELQVSCFLVLTQKDESQAEADGAYERARG
jgi:hypothetical protein